MFESDKAAKKRRSPSLTGYVLWVVLLYCVAAYFPVTFLVALYQYQNAQTWEVRTCEVECKRNFRQYRPRHSFQDKTKVWMTLLYDIKPETEPRVNRRPNILERLNSTDQESKKSGEIKEGLDQMDDYIPFDPNRKPLRERNYSIYHVDGWQYWGEFGLDDFCRTENGKARNDGMIFEFDCYVNPANKDDMALYRGFDLGWFLPIFLLISIGALILLSYIVIPTKPKFSNGA